MANSIPWPVHRFALSLSFGSACAVYSFTSLSRCGNPTHVLVSIHFVILQYFEWWVLIQICPMQISPQVVMNLKWVSFFSFPMGITYLRKGPSAWKFGGWVFLYLIFYLGLMCCIAELFWRLAFWSTARAADRNLTPKSVLKLRSLDFFPFFHRRVCVLTLPPCRSKILCGWDSFRLFFSVYGKFAIPVLVSCSPFYSNLSVQALLFR